MEWSQKGFTTDGDNGFYSFTKIIVTDPGTHHFAFTFSDYKDTGCGRKGNIDFALYMNFTFDEYAKGNGLQFDVNEKVKFTEETDDIAGGDGLVCFASGDIRGQQIAPKLEDSSSPAVLPYSADRPLIKGNDLHIAILIESYDVQESNSSYSIIDKGTYTMVHEDFYVDYDYRNCVVVNLVFKVDRIGDYKIKIQVNWNATYSKTFVFDFYAVTPEDAIGGVDKEPTYEFTDVTQNIDKFIPSSAILGIVLGGEVADKISVILTIVTSIGMIVSVIIPAVLGVKYMLGSIEEKAEYKQGIGTYLIGCCVLFGVCTIVKILMSVGTSINNSM